MSKQKKMTVNKAKHEDFLQFGVEGNCYVVEYEDEHVAFCYARESANQIALACNAHKDLLAACEKSLFLIKCLVTYQHDIIEELRKINPLMPRSTHDNPPVKSIEAVLAAPKS